MLLQHLKTETDNADKVEDIEKIQYQSKTICKKLKYNGRKSNNPDVKQTPIPATVTLSCH